MVIKCIDYITIMATLNIEKLLLAALDNEENANLLNIDLSTIKEQKESIFAKLELPTTVINALMKKLEAYKFVDELPDMKYGSYIRWISLKNPDDLKLTNGGIVCEIKVEDDGIIIVCKNRFNRFFQLNMNENLIFQKMSDQELVLLSALDFVNS